MKGANQKTKIDRKQKLWTTSTLSPLANSCTQIWNFCLSTCHLLSPPSSSSWSSNWASSLLTSPLPFSWALFRRNNPDDEVSSSSRSSSFSFSIGRDVAPVSIQAGQWWTEPRAVWREGDGWEGWDVDSAGLWLEQEHSGTGWERKERDFEFTDASVSPSSRLFLRCLRIDVSHVRFAWYRWSRVSSKNFTTCFLHS